MLNGFLVACLVVLAIALFILALLYGTRQMEFLTSTGHGPHYTHTTLLAVLGILSLGAASLVRGRP